MGTHFLPDLLPDNPGHFIAIELNDGILYRNLLNGSQHGIYGVKEKVTEAEDGVSLMQNEDTRHGEGIMALLHPAPAHYTMMFTINTTWPRSP